MATKASERDEPKPDWWLAKIFLQYHFSQQPLTRNKLAAPLEKMLNDVRTSTEAATIERCAQILDDLEKKALEEVKEFRAQGLSLASFSNEQRVAFIAAAAAIRSMGDAK